jgi:hypothetical protein
MGGLGSNLGLENRKQSQNLQTQLKISLLETEANPPCPTLIPYLIPERKGEVWVAQQKPFTSGQVLVAHICNPSYSGGRDQEDHSSKPAPGK